MALGFACAHAGAAPPEPLRESPVALTQSEHQASEDLEARVRAYRKMTRKLAAKLPKVPKRATPEQIDQDRRAYYDLLKTARAGASRGEFFTPTLEVVVKRTLAAVFDGAEGANMKAAIMENNPGVPNLSVNQEYPDSIPVPTMPPQVLKALPKLEEELEYRFIGERLVLMDAHAHLVVDFTDDVLP